jgi:protocatechuate 3,4-dioxygenase beta subunit
MTSSAVPCVVLAAFLFAGDATRAQDPLPRDVLRGTVTDAAGAPVAGVGVALERHEAGGFNCLDLAFARSTRKVQALTTGKLGTFAAQVPRGVPFDLFVDDGVNAPIRRRAVYAGEDVSLQLVPAARVTVTLRDGDGAPCAGGTVLAWDAQHVTWLELAIDAAGRCQTGRLPPGAFTFDIAPAAVQRPDWVRISLEAGVTTPIELTLDPGCVLRGRVVDAAGKPVAGARVGEGWEMKKFVETDADGRYEMHGYGAPGYGEVRVTGPGCGPQLRRVENNSAGVTEDFTLEPVCEVVGRILDARGRPAAGVYVAAVGGGFSGTDTHDWCSDRTDAEGRYRLRGLRSRIAHSVIVRAEGAAALVGDLPPVGPTPLQLPDVTLRTARYVSGTVVDADGRPLAHVPVSLRGCNADRATLLGSRQPVANQAADYCIAERRMSTDSHGRIHFADVPVGEYMLTVGRGIGDSTLTVVVAADRDPDPIQVQR